jgi:hypothetical protein
VNVLVKLGQRGEREAEVVEGLKAGDVVLLDPAAKEGNRYRARLKTRHELRAPGGPALPSGGPRADGPHPGVESAPGVGVIIFLSALIAGLQQSIIERTLGNQAHVILQPRTRSPVLS